MKNKTTILSTILCLLPMVLSAAVYEKLPQQVAVHFDISGNPDNYVPKVIAAFGIPLLLAIINLYTNFRVSKDPKVENASSSLRAITRWLVSLLSVIMVPVTLFGAMERKIPIIMLTTAITGVVIVICGNYLPKCKQNYTIGIKLPWTLDNDDNWNRTHRFSGFVWVTGGFIIIINAFIQIPNLLTAVVIGLVLLPFLYSYLFYKSQKTQG
ncbi:SdpI family protein [Anaerocolumna sp. MB42-C2]|uniref:SdpI family protein n=1 Tax=Anaerocolumna sp. MB42-C2 TaxID=3070997 RepID=UPI0027E164E6|nr:SdpI family protein [Anaerocolumna sp. MB42-C2]WMJ90110.1 SdpI family protein [Anaerocolumna sp. MB42-C2]